METTRRQNLMAAWERGIHPAPCFAKALRGGESTNE